MGKDRNVHRKSSLL